MRQIIRFLLFIIPIFFISCNKESIYRDGSDTMYLMDNITIAYICESVSVGTSFYSDNPVVRIDCIKDVVKYRIVDALGSTMFCDENNRMKLYGNTAKTKFIITEKGYPVLKLERFESTGDWYCILYRL